MPASPRQQVWYWLPVLGIAGVAMALLFPDSYQQDGGHHFLFARFAWKHHSMFVGVWARPLFTFLYSFPALLGYLPAKLFTVAICLVTAHQTVRLAEHFKMGRAAWCAPLLFLQPSYLMLSADTMTEPLFALLLVLALRLHTSGKVVAGMFVASLMILVRPEGFFLGMLWGIWVLLDSRLSRLWWKRLLSTSMLASGTFIWWLSALSITSDPLFIKHNWPKDWDPTGAVYGTGAIFDYVKQAAQISGPLLSFVLLLGLAAVLLRRQMGTVTSVFLIFLVMHSVFRTFGFFGAAGYPRYFVCVAPAIALLILAGWNQLASWFARVPGLIRVAAATSVLFLSAVASISYTDASTYTRDAHAVAEMAAWFRAHERPVTRLVWSQAYMSILLDHDIVENPSFTADKQANLELLQKSPAGTLIFWDGDTGPAWYRFNAEDLEAAGYLKLRSESYVLGTRLGPRTSWWFHSFGPRSQSMHLFYKEH